MTLPRMTVSEPCWSSAFLNSKTTSFRDKPGWVLQTSPARLPPRKQELDEGTGSQGGRDTRPPGWRASQGLASPSDGLNSQLVPNC